VSLASFVAPDLSNRRLRLNPGKVRFLFSRFWCLANTLRCFALPARARAGRASWRSR
jgi:hypothetical protein